MDPVVKPRGDGRGRGNGRSEIIDQSEISILYHNTVKSVLQNANFASSGAMCIYSNKQISS